MSREARHPAGPPASATGSRVRRAVLKVAFLLFLLLVVLPAALQSLANGVTDSLLTPPSAPPAQATIPTPPQLGTPTG